MYDKLKDVTRITKRVSWSGKGNVEEHLEGVLFLSQG